MNQSVCTKHQPSGSPFEYEDIMRGLSLIIAAQNLTKPIHAGLGVNRTAAAALMSRHNESSSFNIINIYEREPRIYGKQTVCNIKICGREHSHLAT